MSDIIPRSLVVCVIGSELPSRATHASGVVIRNDSVVRAIRINRKPSAAATCGNIGCIAIRMPIKTICTPRP
jgi:hypothetical protein